MKTGKKGIELLKKFESCSLKAYKGVGEKYYSIGWGHQSPDIKPGDIISAAQANKYLIEDLKIREKYVSNYVTSFKPNQNQFDALVDYVYNRGLKGLKELCSNSKTPSDFSKNILVYWGTNAAVKNGLMRRRMAEKELFDTPIDESNSNIGYPEPTKLLKYDKYLRVDDEVKWLQYMLNKAMKLELDVDGQFGNATKEAVISFQTKAKIKVDGVVGPQTVEALKKYL